MGSQEIDPTLAFVVEQPQPGIEVAPESLPVDPFRRRTLEQRLLDRASHWARLCATERHAI